LSYGGESEYDYYMTYLLQFYQFSATSTCPKNFVSFLRGVI